MNEVEVTTVSIDQDGRIRIAVRGSRFTDYEHIYRDASGVRWDRERRCLCSEVPRKLSHADWYRIIHDAVRSEYGEVLVLTEHTKWENVTSDVQADIRQRAAGPAA